MQERGIYIGPNEDSFKNDFEVKKDLAQRGLLARAEIQVVEFNTPLASPKEFEYWSALFRHHQEIEQDKEQRTTHAEITFPHETTAINFIADIHAGHSTTHYERLEQEIDVIMGTPNSYIVFVGDLIDAMNWNPGQFDQMKQTPDQIQYMRAMMRKVSEGDRLLAAFGGDHDLWPQKTGMNPYFDFAENYGAYYMQGLGYLTLNVGDVTYKVAGAHQLPGHSMYNNTHPQNRAEKFGGARGADVIFSGHNHKKGASWQTTKEWPGEAREVFYVALGPYKPTDGWLRKKGFAEQTAKEMYGGTLILNPNEKDFEYYPDIIKANTRKMP